MAFHEIIIPSLVLVLMVGVLGLVWQLRRDLRNHQSIDSDHLSSALTETWRDMEFDQTITRLETHANEMQRFHGDITKLLRSPRERGEFGEQQLDIILNDHLPPEMYGIRKQVANGKTPDASIQSSAGIICIDSKFPLDNYEKCLDADTDAEKDRFQRAFRKNVSDQLEKIATDYVAPADGTVDFAFAFVPSESVYYHLISEEYDMLRSYTKRGVQVVSPLTLGHKLELIKADVQAQKLSEQAEQTLEHLKRLGMRFDRVEDEWTTLYNHIQNAKNRADDLNKQYQSLRAAFDRIEEPTLK